VFAARVNIQQAPAFFRTLEYTIELKLVVQFKIVAKEEEYIKALQLEGDGAVPRNRSSAY